MRQHTFIGLLFALAVLLLGMAWLGGAVARFRARGQMTSTFGSSASGMYTFALAEIGCGGLLVAAGVVILAVVLVGAR